MNTKLSTRTILYLISGVMVLFVAGLVIGTQIVKADLPQENSADTATSPGGAAVNPPRLAQDFTLTDQTGQPVSLSDLRGKATLLFFGYTHCPDICPTTLFDYTLVKRELGQDAEKVAFVFISVDGTRDTPEIIAEYLGRFDSSFIGLTGDADTLERIAPEYGLVYQAEGHHHADANANYFVAHTSPSFLIDPDGYIRTVYFYGTEPDVIAAGIRRVLN